jgi:Tubulin/FtsZ family, GTPase domain
MNINLKKLDIGELRPRINIFGVGGAGGNAVNNMINAGLHGVDFVVANTDAQALTTSRAERIIQMGVTATGGLGAGSQPDVGRAAAEEVFDEIRDHLTGAHMVFITAGMGGDQAHQRPRYALGRHVWHYGNTTPVPVRPMELGPLRSRSEGPAEHIDPWKPG